MDKTNNPLAAYFYNNPGRMMTKWLHYLDIYHRHFEPFRNKPITMVEFGVQHGGSLQMWKHYFGPQAKIFGVDIDPRCAAFTEDQIQVVLGDQADRAFLRRLGEQVGPIDIVLDDGGHSMAQQLATFEVMWPLLRDGGVFLVEDLHTSYWREYGGSYKGPGTFIEYAKAIIDKQHAWHSRDPKQLAVDGLTRSVYAMHTYDSVIAFDKRTVTEPSFLYTGTKSF